MEGAGVSSEEEGEVFAGFTIEEVAHLQVNQQRRDVEQIFGNSDEEEEEFLGFERHANADNSDIEVFACDDNESDEETPPENEEISVEWSSNLHEINVEEFRLPHGPTVDLPDDAMAKDFFDLFIDDNYLDEIVRNSIAYARWSGDENFTTTRTEISAFMGLNIFMGIHELPQVSMYWDSDNFIGVEGFKKTIPQRRFKELSQYFHLVDPDHEDPSDALCKVRPLVDLLQDRFSAAYIPGKNISVDEGLVKFNGRLAFKQYMPLKPNKFGIKVWLLADADTYFVPRYQIYLGKDRNNEELFKRKGLGYYVVWTLGEPYLDANRHFFFDNFFSSVDLMKSLESRGTYACGTVRSNRKGFPADLKNNKLVRGEIRTRQDGNLVTTLWKDKRDVAILSTNTSPASQIFAERQKVGGRLKLVVPKELMVKPPVIEVYNSGMNGVDVNDQYRSYYPPGMISRKWWKYLFWFFVNLSIVNGYILEKIAGKRKRRQLEFRIELAKQLIAGYNGYKRLSNTGTRAIKSITTQENVRGHFLGKIQGRKRACAMCAKVRRE